MGLKVTTQPAVEPVTLAEQKLERQHEALIELYDEIKPTIKEAGYHIAACQEIQYYADRTYDG